MLSCCLPLVWMGWTNPSTPAIEVASHWLYKKNTNTLKDAPMFNTHSPTVTYIAAKLSKDNQHQQGQPISLANASREFQFSFFKREDLLNTYFYSTNTLKKLNSVGLIITTHST
jgi:hypothetical protein